MDLQLDIVHVGVRRHHLPNHVKLLREVDYLMAGGQRFGNGEILRENELGPLNLAEADVDVLFKLGQMFMVFLNQF